MTPPVALVDYMSKLVFGWTLCSTHPIFYSQNSETRCYMQRRPMREFRRDWDVPLFDSNPLQPIQRSISDTKFIGCIRGFVYSRGQLKANTSIITKPQ